MISYDELLQMFWEGHNPTRKSFSTQYKAAVFYHNEEQRKAVLQSKAEWEKKLGATIVTDILPVGDFYLAEGYHQKYYLQQNSSFAKEMRRYYPDITGLICSSAAARLNGYLGGYGSREILQQEKDDLGLSPAALNALEGLVGF